MAYIDGKEANNIQPYENYLPLMRAVLSSKKNEYLSKNINILKIMDFEDFLQEFYFTYNDCISTYDSKKSSFETYFSNMCRYTIQKIVREHFTETQTDFIEDIISEEDSEEDFGGKSIDFDSDELSEELADKVDFVKDMIDCENNKNILTDHFILGLTNIQISQKYNIKVNTAKQIFKRFKNKVLKNYKGAI